MLNRIFKHEIFPFDVYLLSALFFVFLIVTEGREQKANCWFVCV